MSAKTQSAREYERCSEVNQRLNLSYNLKLLRLKGSTEKRRKDEPNRKEKCLEKKKKKSNAHSVVVCTNGDSKKQEGRLCTLICLSRVTSILAKQLFTFHVRQYSAGSHSVLIHQRKSFPSTTVRVSTQHLVALITNS